MGTLLMGIAIGIIGLLILIIYSYILLRMGYISGCKDWKQTQKWIEQELKSEYKNETK